MNLKIVRAAVGVIVLAAVLTANPVPPEKKVFQARLMSRGLLQNPMVQIEITGETSPEEAFRLQEIYAQRGEDAFRSAFRKTTRGALKFFGGEQPSIRFHTVQESPTEKGLQIRMFAENRALTPGGEATILGLLFLVVILDVDSSGKGEGRVYQSASIRFTPEGAILLDSYRTAPWQLISVRKSR